MPSSSMSPEKPRSIAAQTESRGAVEHSTCCSQASHRAQTLCGFSAGGLRGDLFLPALSDPDPCIAFSAGGLRGDLFLPALSDPDPCIAPRARKRRHPSGFHDEEENNW
jgi:hypothetical protein